MQLPELRAVIAVLKKTGVANRPKSAYTIRCGSQPEDPGSNCNQIEYSNARIQALLNILADQLMMPKLDPPNVIGKSEMLRERYLPDTIDRLRSYLDAGEVLIEADKEVNSKTEG